MSFKQITKSLWVDGQRRQGRVRMEMPLNLLGRIERAAPVEPGQAKPQVVSQFLDFNSGPADALSPLPVSEILPRPEDLYFLKMRAISQTVIEGHWVDYSRPGVLEASVALLKNQRLCKDHCYWNIEDALGAIVETEWDAQGAEANGLPGINARFFIDSKIAPGVVRRLAYPVPAIHSCSVTVGFEWEPSHPELLEDERFWWRLGEEQQDGQIVRLIATRILFYRELSLVYEGADPNAKRLSDDDEMPAPRGADDDDDYGRKKESMAAPVQSQESATVKLTEAQKKLLGLAHAGADVPDTDVTAALDRLAAAQASHAATLAAAEAIITAQRAEVTRLATLAEGVDGKLPEPVSLMIEHTPAEKLPGLLSFYQEKAQAKFPVNGRSSVEDSPVIKEQSKAPAKGERIKFFS